MSTEIKTYENKQENKRQEHAEDHQNGRRLKLQHNLAGGCRPPLGLEGAPKGPARDRRKEKDDKDTGLEVDPSRLFQGSLFYFTSKPVPILSGVILCYPALRMIF